MTEPVTIGGSLRAARGDRTKNQAAEEIGTTWTSYDLWERGGWIPDIKWAEPIARFTGQRLEAILLLMHQERVARKQAG